MRLSDYLTLAGKDIRRQPVRTGLTLLALAISTVILVTLLAITVGARQTLIEQLGLSDSLQDLVVTPNQSVGATLFGGKVQLANEATATLNDEAVSKLQSIPNVGSVDPRVALYELKTFRVEGNEQNFVAQASGITTTSPQTVPLLAGRLFDGASTTHEVILGSTYARELGFEGRYSDLLGKEVRIMTQNGYRGEGALIPALRSSQAQLENFANRATELSATVIGISTDGSNQNQLLLPMGWARQIKTVQTYNATGVLARSDPFDRTGYSSIIVTADSVTSVRAVSQQLDNAGYNYVSTQDQIDRINGLTAIIGGVLGSISLISLITACLGIANTMLMAASEQRYAIGVWRAVGARKYVIALRFIIQACLLGLLGGLIGALIGYGVSLYTNRYIGRLLEAQNLPVVDVIQVTPGLLVLCVLLTMLFSVLAGLYPAWRAAREDPSRALTSQ